MKTLFMMIVGKIEFLLNMLMSIDQLAREWMISTWMSLFNTPVQEALPILMIV